MLAGTAVAIAMWMILQILGLGLGLTAIDVDHTSSVKAAAIGTGIWGVVAPVIAFFVGGIVAGRATHVVTRVGHVVSGLVMWSLAAIGGLIAMGMLVSSLIGASVSAGATVAGAAGDAAGSTLAGLAGQAGSLDNVADAFGIKASDALMPVNQRLRAEGKPAITAPQLEAAVKEIVKDAIRDGKLDRGMMVTSIADQTALSQADAEEIATRVEAQYMKARAAVEQKLAAAKEKAKAAAQATTDATGKLMLAIFGAMVLALGAAILGAVLGGRRYTLHPMRRSHA